MVHLPSLPLQVMFSRDGIDQFLNRWQQISTPEQFQMIADRRSLNVWSYGGERSWIHGGISVDGNSSSIGHGEAQSLNLSMSTTAMEGLPLMSNARKGNIGVGFDLCDTSYSCGALQDENSLAYDQLSLKEWVNSFSDSSCDMLSLQMAKAIQNSPEIFFHAGYQGNDPAARSGGHQISYLAVKEGSYEEGLKNGDYYTKATTIQEASSIDPLPEQSSVYIYKEVTSTGLLTILNKELTSSDVNIGRIIIPKNEAEQNFPPLLNKAELKLEMVDRYFPAKWQFKYGYWTNKENRIYVLKNTGEFTKSHGLRQGDLFTIYLKPDTGEWVAGATKFDRE